MRMEKISIEIESRQSIAESVESHQDLPHDHINLSRYSNHDLTTRKIHLLKKVTCNAILCTLPIGCEN